jgi:hypothetical protein
MCHGDVTHGGVKRDFLEKVDGVWQGCIFRWTQGLEAGVNRISFGPDGALYVGGIGSTGNWGQEGKKRFGLQRLKYNGKPTFEILAMRARSDGFDVEFTELCRDYPKIAKTNHRNHLGTLGGGNHFIEVCLDEDGAVWFMLHSGSRGVGNAIGTMFIELARQDAQRNNANLPDRDLAYFEEGARYFGDYVRAVGWAQQFARLNREVMMRRVIEAAKTVIGKSFQSHIEAVNCHHNYVQQERHFGADVFVTRKGAVSAQAGELGIIPGSMGARSYIVRGKGHPESFASCSHGAGRTMSRGEAKRRFTLDDHRAATEGVDGVFFGPVGGVGIGATSTMVNSTGFSSSGSEG